MVELIESDYRILRDLLDQGLKKAEEEGDAVSNVMLIGQKNKVDTHIWMLNAFLNRPVTE